MSSSSPPDHFVIRVVCAAVVLITMALFAALIWQATHGHAISTDLDKAATAGFVAMIGLLTRTSGGPDQVQVTNTTADPIPVDTVATGLPEPDDIPTTGAPDAGQSVLVIAAVAGIVCILLLLAFDLI